MFYLGSLINKTTNYNKNKKQKKHIQQFLYNIHLLLQWVGFGGTFGSTPFSRIPCIDI